MKWEYRIEQMILNNTLLDIHLSTLNQLGSEGWEAVTLLQNPTPRSPGDYADTLVLLKRIISK
jgi:hypothetical protein